MKNIKINDGVTGFLFWLNNIFHIVLKDKIDIYLSLTYNKKRSDNIKMKYILYNKEIFL